MTKVKLITNPEEYFDMLTADKIVVTDASFLSDNVMELQYENKENFFEPNPKTNVVIAAFTTAHTQLKLYSTLEQLGERVLYYDTDLVIYVSKPGVMEPETGVYLGALTDELCNGKMCCKIRGITLNFQTLETVNVDVIRDMVVVGPAKVISVDIPFKITRNTSTKQIITNQQHKDYRVVYNKHVIIDHFNTIPYSY